MNKYNIVSHTSPNRGSRMGYRPDMICCHSTCRTVRDTVARFCDPGSGTSAHFVVARDGTVHSFVALERAAWDNGSNTVDPSAHNHYSRALSSVVRERASDANLYTVAVEFENRDTGVLTDVQYDAGLWLMRHIISQLKEKFGVDFSIDREHIIGHCEISPYNKTNCPGKDFPYERFIDDLKKGEGDKEEELEPEKSETEPKTVKKTLNRLISRIFSRSVKEHL